MSTFMIRISYNLLILGFYIITSSPAYAKHHRDILVQFGRFPHRNKILGRPSTSEEQEYLKEFQGF